MVPVSKGTIVQQALFLLSKINVKLGIIALALQDSRKYAQMDISKIKKALIYVNSVLVHITASKGLRRFVRREDSVLGSDCYYKISQGLILRFCAPSPALSASYSFALYSIPCFLFFTAV